MNMDCESLQPIRNLRCTVPTDLLTFTYSPRPCVADSNSQEARGKCETFDKYNPVQQARVDCAVNGKRAWVTPAQVSVGQAFQVHAVGNTLLTGSLACAISNASGEIMQAVTIDVSGASRLELRDSFGSLQLEGCGTKNCIEHLAYSADVTNRGSGSVDVSVHMEVGSSTKVLTISNPIPSGQTRTSSDYDTVFDICTSSFLPANVFVSGVSLFPPFDTCEATDVLHIGQSEAPSPSPSAAPNFQTGGECDVEADLTCKNAKNVPCDDIKPPKDVRCAMPNMKIFTLRFRYVPSGCGIKANQQGDKYFCRDIMPIDQKSSVKIECYDAEQATSAMETLPPVVAPGTVFAMSKERVGSLPANVTCKVKTIKDDMAIQTVTFDTSGKVELDLKDRFGSLQVEGCDDRSCLDTWTYTTTARNAGIGNIFVQHLNLNFTGEAPIDLLSATDRVTRLLPGEVLPKKTIERPVDICLSKDYSVTATAKALREGDKPGSATCDDITTLPLELTAPCNLKVDLKCTATGDDGYKGNDCKSIALEENLQCRCSPCAQELRFRYTSAPCPSSDSAGFSCKSVTKMNPMDGARVLVRRGFTDVYDGEVKTGQDVIIKSGDCVPDNLVFFVMHPGTSIVTQKFSLDTRCSRANGIRLLNSYGAFQFSGYSCGDDDSEKHNCYVGVRQGACAENDGTETRTLSRFELNINGDTNAFDLIKTAGSAEKILLPGGHFCNDTVTTEIERCRQTRYVASATAYADPNKCVTNKVYEHDIMRGIWPPNTPITPERPVTSPTVPAPRPTPIAPTPIAPTPTSPVYVPRAPSPAAPTPPDLALSPSNNCLLPLKPVFCP